MPLQIECACGKKLKIRDELAGKKVKCPGCGKVIAAAAPPPVVEPVDQLEVVEDETAVQPSPPPPPAPVWRKKEKTAWEKGDKRKKKAKDHDDDEEEAESFSHWLFPGTLSTEIMVVADDGLYFDNLKGDAVKKVPKLLKNGNHPSGVLGPKAICVEWGAIKSIYSNKRLRGFTIHYVYGDPVFKKMTPADCAMRDEIFKTLKKFLAPHWEMTTYKHTPITAMFLPVGSIAATVLITAGLAYFSTFIIENLDRRLDAGERFVRVHTLEKLLYDIGPLGTGAIGLVIALCLTAWLLARILVPPIEMSIHPTPVKPEEPEDD